VAGSASTSDSTTLQTVIQDTSRLRSSQAGNTFPVSRSAAFTASLGGSLLRHDASVLTFSSLEEVEAILAASSASSENFVGGPSVADLAELIRSHLC